MIPSFRSKKALSSLAVLACLALSCTSVVSAQEHLKRSVASAGAVAQSGSHSLRGTIGQPLTGTARTILHEGQFGFWCTIPLSPTSIDHGTFSPFRFRIAAYPNPANGLLTIRVTIPTTMLIRVSILDIAGKTVRKLQENIAPPGESTFHWSGTDALGRRYPSGTYFIVAERLMRGITDPNSETLRVILY